MRARQAGLLKTLLPQLTLTPKLNADPRSYFPRAPREVWLEVGFGAGEHLVWQAENNPDVGLIGAEPYISGQAKLLAKIADRNLSNIRLYPEDARDVIAALPEASLARVFVLFPDPWPKTRHHKRRFIQTDLLDQLARVMKPGAQLRFATDDKSYLVFALERFMANHKFIWTAEAPSDWRTRPANWPETRYEAKAVKQRETCIYLAFRRV